MIYYAKTPKQGMTHLEETYNLRAVPFKQYFPENKVRRYAQGMTDDEFFSVIGVSNFLHAFVLDDLRMYFHPDEVLQALKNAHYKYFSSLV